ncbi:phospholipase DDHD1 [Chaetomidium leptoderma]|uniref:Phospholipase DDHD1 n=1 Tax=Chaetomidium leptoderma TaxID=669021 RepID=A0AAN6VIT3_9PEZI|nr:phospholipase DDHD1 [Chaetomidium leptoderma]
MTTPDTTQTQTQHTLDPSSCRLAPVPDPQPIKGLEGIPRVRAQFFYASSIPIDDPLSAATTIVGSADAKSSSKLLPVRPFAPGDNAALERAWLGFASDRHRRNHAHYYHAQHNRNRNRHRSPSPSLSRENAEKLAAVVNALAAKHREKHDREGSAGAAAAAAAVALGGGGGGLGGGGVPVCCAELAIDASAELRREFCAVTRRRQPVLDHDRVLEGVMAQLARLRGVQQGSASDAALALALGTSPAMMQQLVGSVGSRTSIVSVDGAPLGSSLPGGGFIPARPPGLDDGISGKPFVRVEPTSRSNRSSGVATPDDRAVKSVLRGRARGDSRASARGPPPPPAAERLEDSVEVPVGISRLHMVSLPVLQMKPIYWSPVNDISTVLRATWFYRDTMVPVEPDVANQLESGYRELRPWTETWNDELKSALDVGPLGEEKVSHRLWPEVSDNKRHKSKDGLPLEPPISTDPFCAARCFRGEAATEGTLEPVHSEQDTALAPPESRMYSSYHVIYKDGSTAFMLKPSQKPSAYYGRKPISKIMKGMTVGLPVVRGFDRAAWERVHDKRAASRSKNTAAVTPTAELRQTAQQGGCPGCRLEKDRGQVTDLVLIAHGIGQKLSERVESFHFTHAVNAFRRDVNIELETPVVKSVLRPEQNGIMVLPVNWRHLLSFEDGDSASEEGQAAYSPEGFTLKDIEPSTIPAVRGMISDVMFDIPFYMSHLKPKMIAALVGEANRVYRLWCRNNPGFAEKGRVHLIAHSLGSAMAIEVLSKQPTRVPRPLDLSAPTPDTRFFEFDTTNLFLLGSPAGFFLLLERGGLVPRRGRLKPGADAADTVAKDVVGEVGMFGCIAVDNIYNILAKEDPIAYLLNGTIDPVYAASLKVAYVPSINTSFFKSVGDAVRGLAGAAPSTTTTSTSLTGDGQNSGNNKPPAVARLPSQLELEVHDFSREEIAERKAFLLNDNGQIDYFLRSGGGPLEIQYLNMLSAHSSYWTNQDLMRLLCLEIGRVPGRRHALGSMRAAKVKGRFVGQ